MTTILHEALFLIETQNVSGNPKNVLYWKSCTVQVHNWSIPGRRSTTSSPWGVMEWLGGSKLTACRSGVHKVFGGMGAGAHPPTDHDGAESTQLQEHQEYAY
jgi:hypothetical protein